MSRELSRRQFIKTSAVGIAAAGAAVTVDGIVPAQGTASTHPYPVLPDKKTAIPSPSTQPQFLNDHQYQLVAAIAALIVPTDEDPGAAEAGVADYIDKLLAGSEKYQKQYLKGLEWLDNVSRDQYGKDFINLNVREQIELLVDIDETETRLYSPVSGLLERIQRKLDVIWSTIFGVGLSSYFFHTIKKHVFLGYYSNPISWKAVGYYGPPQPVGYPDYSEPPSQKKYIDTMRPITNNTCGNCHFDLLDEPAHEDQDDCMECHDPHSPIKEYINNG